GPGVLRAGGGGGARAALPRRHARLHVRGPVPLRAHGPRHGLSRARSRLRPRLERLREGARAPARGPVKLASLKGPTRDGTLCVVNRALTRAMRVGAIVATMQQALERWESVEGRLREAAASLED